MSDEEKMTVFVTSGPDTPQRCATPFYMANIAAAMGGAPSEILARQLALFSRVHPEYGAGVRQALIDAHGYEANALPISENTEDLRKNA